MDRDIPADCQAVRAGNADSQAGEAAWADPDQDARRHMAAQHVGDHRREKFGMAARDHLVGPSKQRPVRGEQRGGAGRGRGVEGEDQMLGLRCIAPDEATRGPDEQANSVSGQTASTFSTSGT